MTRWPGCSVCGSHSVRMVSTRERGTLYLCNHHRAVCWPHLKDPCAECDADGAAGNRHEPPKGAA